MKLSKKWLVDTAERVVGTFLEAFVATLVVSASGVSLTAVKTAVLAGLASALTLVKSLVGAYVGNPDSASVIPSVGAAPQSAPAALLAPTKKGVLSAFLTDNPQTLVRNPLAPSGVVAEEVARCLDRYREMTPKAPVPPHPGAVPADRVTPLYPSPQQS